MQRHDGLEQASRTCCCFGVSDLAFHRAKRTPLMALRIGSTKYLTQTFELGGVASLGAGAVGLHQLDSFGAVTGNVISAAQGFGLAFRHRCVNTFTAAIGRSA